MNWNRSRIEPKSGLVRIGAQLLGRIAEVTCPRIAVLGTDSAIGKEIMLLSAHTDAVEDATFSPDGRRLATASDDGTARIWDADTGREIMLLRGHKDVGFGPDLRLQRHDDAFTQRVDGRIGHLRKLLAKIIV